MPRRRTLRCRVWARLIVSRQQSPQPAVYRFRTDSYEQRKSEPSLCMFFIMHIPLSLGADPFESVPQSHSDRSLQLLASSCLHVDGLCLWQRSGTRKRGFNWFRITKTSYTIPPRQRKPGVFRKGFMLAVKCQSLFQVFGITHTKTLSV